jgi:hypothetical protein
VYFGGEVSSGQWTVDSEIALGTNSPPRRGARMGGVGKCWIAMILPTPVRVGVREASARAEAFASAKSALIGALLSLPATW